MTMKLKSYLKFINEAQEVDESLNDEIFASLSDKDREIKEDLVNKIVKSINPKKREVFDEFLSGYIRDSEENQIEGLINDSDVNEFFLSYRNDINRILSEVNFFDEVPSEMNCFSIDDFIVKGTKKAIGEILLSIKEDLSKEIEGGGEEETSQTEV